MQRIRQIRERLSASLAFELLHATWRLGRAYTVAYACLRLTTALAPLGQLWIGKLIVDAIVEGQRTRLVDPVPLTKLIVAEFLLVAVLETSTRVCAWIDAVLSDRFTVDMTSRLLSHAATLDLMTLERADVQDALERARRQTNDHVSVLSVLFQGLQQLVTCGSLVAAVAIVGPVFMLVQAAGMLPLVLAEHRWIRRRQVLRRSLSAARRWLDYLVILGTGLEAAKEVRVYGLAEHLRVRFRGASRTYVAANQALARWHVTAVTWLSLLSTAIYYAGYGVLAWRALAGSLTFGQFVFVAGAFHRCRSEIAGISSAVNRASEAIGNAADVFAFFRIQPVARPRRMCRASTPHSTDGNELEFRAVSFRYPGRASLALDNVSFRVRAGERVALVGENGSGKTTLVKLLCGLYEPDQGQILIGGVDMRAIDPAMLRASISVVFQDYVRFDLPVRDNIGFGRLDRYDDLVAIRDAAARSGALDTIAALPNEFEQLLGRRFEGGVNLSGGQWQRIALARASLRDGRLVIFDEPTASLDPRAEHAVFRQLFDLARDRTAIVVSHRLTSARVADRILVLSGGQVVEDGEHSSLIARGGQYAELFQLQTTPWRALDIV